MSMRNFQIPILNDSDSLHRLMQEENCFPRVDTFQGCRPWGCRECQGTPRFWQIS